REDRRGTRAALSAFMRLLLALAVLVGCAPASSSRSRPGRADGAIDVGPLEWGTQQVAGGTALRVESYGGMALSLSAGTQLTVLDAANQVVAEGAGSIDVTLESAGVYRVAALADTQLTAQCTTA